MEKIVIIGAGAIGRALESVLTEKGHTIALWDKDTTKVANQKPLGDLIPSANFVFLCTPSPAIREAVISISSFIKKETVVLSVAKGIEAGSAQTMDEVLAESLPQGQSFALLSGPMLAEELSKGMRGMAVYASMTAMHSGAATLFKESRLYVTCSDDIHGVALCGVLKNIYAFGLGITCGLKWGLNGKGWLAAKAIEEMVKIVHVLGGREETALGTAGLGDLIATGYSPYSRNHQIGCTLAETGELGRSEGVVSLPSLVKKLPSIAPYPLLQALQHIIAEKAHVKETFEALT